MVVFFNNYVTVQMNYSYRQSKFGFVNLMVPFKSFLFQISSYTDHKILFPKGISDTSINLKCCNPKGMPITVRHRIQPKTK